MERETTSEEPQAVADWIEVRDMTAVLVTMASGPAVR